MTDWVWANFKQMLCDVLGSHDSELIALNSVLVIPRLIDEIDSLRAKSRGGSDACARKHGSGVYDIVAEQIQEAGEVCGEMLRLMLHNETIEQQTTEQLELAIKDICSGDNLARLVRERVDSELRGEVFRRVKELTDEAIRAYTDKIAKRIAANVEQALENC